jgi:maleylacetate reductase
MPEQSPQILVISIPISLSESECSHYAGVTDPKINFKQQYPYEKMLSSPIILDPTLVVSTPIPLWLASGTRSIVHCVDGCLSKHFTEESDSVAVNGRHLLTKGLLKTKKKPDELETRLNC